MRCGAQHVKLFILLHLYLSISLSLYLSISLSLDLSISQSLNLSISRSLDLSISRSLDLSISRSLYLSISLSLYLSISLSLYLSISLSLYLSISLSLYLSISLSLYLSISLSLYLSISLSLYLSISLSLSTCIACSISLQLASARRMLWQFAGSRCSTSGAATSSSPSFSAVRPSLEHLQRWSQSALPCLLPFKVVSWSRFSRILGLASFLHKASVFRANLRSQLLGKKGYGSPGRPRNPQHHHLKPVLAECWQFPG